MSVLLPFDGRVEWMDKQGFNTLLAQQQGHEEIHILLMQ
jgi:hypothetical protein